MYKHDPRSVVPLPIAGDICCSLSVELVFIAKTLDPVAYLVLLLEFLFQTKRTAKPIFC